MTPEDINEWFVQQVELSMPLGVKTVACIGTGRGVKFNLERWVGAPIRDTAVLVDVAVVDATDDAVDTLGQIAKVVPSRIYALVHSFEVGKSGFHKALEGYRMVHRAILVDTGLEIVFLLHSRRRTEPIEGSFSFFGQEQ